jgi:hypothetical protein
VSTDLDLSSLTFSLPEPSGASVTRARADAILGPALDQWLRPALEQVCPLQERVSAYAAARGRALTAYEASVARGEGHLLPEEAASTATGPGPHPARTAFDRASSDLLLAWFGSYARAVAASPATREERLAFLRELEALARGSFAWSPEYATRAGMQVMAARLGVEAEQEAR